MIRWTLVLIGILALCFYVLILSVSVYEDYAFDQWANEYKASTKDTSCKGRSDWVDCIETEWKESEEYQRRLEANKADDPGFQMRVAQAHIQTYERVRDNYGSR